MKNYFLTHRTNKIELVNTIIKNEDLDATAKIEADAYGNLVITIIADEEDYEILKEMFDMVGGK